MANTENGFKRMEFGSLEWCQAAANLGVRLVEESDLDLAQFNWGFSEEYTSIPERLRAGREHVGYHFMIHDGRATGGASLPAECLTLPGFHVSVPWAHIAHSSYYPFNRDGWRERATTHSALRSDLQAAGIDPNWYSLHEEEAAGDGPRCPVCGSTRHERPDCPVWPPGIGEVLAENTGKEPLWLKRSPELEDLAETEWGVPVFSEMTDGQKVRYIALVGEGITPLYKLLRA